MNTRNNDNRHISAMRCDRVLNYLDYARKANCSNNFFDNQQQSDARQKKCVEAIEKMDELARTCFNKFA